MPSHTGTRVRVHAVKETGTCTGARRQGIRRRRLRRFMGRVRAVRFMSQKSLQNSYVCSVSIGE